MLNGTNEGLKIVVARLEKEIEELKQENRRLKNALKGEKDLTQILIWGFVVFSSVMLSGVFRFLKD